MTVYVTGRSTAERTSVYGGSVEETADSVTRAGGRGIAVRLDHADNQSVAGLFERIRAEHGRLDILVNNAAKVAEPAASKGFWERPIEVADILDVGLRSHYVASYFAVPLMIANRRGLIVHTGHYGAVSYHQGPAYGAQKAGGDKMAADMAKELRPYDIAVVSIWMGGLDTERARAYFAQMSEVTRPRVKRESPQYTGRLIASLYRSQMTMQVSGRAMIGAEDGEKLGVTEPDGGSPPSYRDTLGSPPVLQSSLTS